MNLDRNARNYAARASQNALLISRRLYVDSLNIYHEHTFYTPFTRSNTSLNLHSISEFPQYPLIIFSNTRDTKVC